MELESGVVWDSAAYHGSRSWPNPWRKLTVVDTAVSFLIWIKLAISIRPQCLDLTDHLGTSWELGPGKPAVPSSSAEIEEQVKRPGGSIL